MRHTMVRVNGIDLHLRAMGEPEAPLILFLHGFPEFSGAWDEVLPAFADAFHAVAPDQRGYARSSKPEVLEAYRVKQLVRDVLGLGEHLWPSRPFVLVGHDWGASVAYATAMAAPAAHRQAHRRQRRAPRALPARSRRGRGGERASTYITTCATPKPRRASAPTTSRSSGHAESASAHSPG